MKHKYMIILLLMTGLCFQLSAQTKIAVYVSSVLSEVHNTLLADNLMEAFAKSDKYIAVNRSRAVNDILEEAHETLRNGHIEFAQITNAAKQFGENQLCAVSVVQLDNSYVFRATILDVESNTVIKSTSYHINKSYKLSYDDIYLASSTLIDGLFDRPKPQVQQNTEPSEKKSVKLNHTSIAWGIAGVGYPWSLTTSFNFRYGGIVGVGVYADIGMDFTHIEVDNNAGEFSYTTATKLHYAAGAKFYMYQGLNIGCGYGSIHKPKENIVYAFGSKLENNEAKAIRKQFSDSGHGLLVHVGYDYYTNFLFFLGFNAGASFDFNNRKIEPMFNLKIGMSFDYLL